MRKKLLLYLFVFLIISSIAYAVGCQYPETEDFFESEKALVYPNSETKAGEDLIFLGFTEGQIVSFTIQNPNTFDVMVVLNYTIEGTGGGNIQHGKWISVESDTQVTNVCSENGDIIGNCTFIKESLEYYVSKPKLMYPGEAQLKKTRTICPKKNDGQPCSTNQECGSKVCNFAGYCGNFTICPEGTTNCMDQSCLAPGVKEINETYFCEWECKSGRGKDGICKRGWIPTIVFTIIIIFLVSISVFFVIKIFDKKERDRKKEQSKKEADDKAEEILGNAKQEANKIIKEAQKELVKINRDLDHKRSEKEKLNSKLHKTEEDKKKLIKLNEDIKKLKNKVNNENKELLEGYKEKHGHEFFLDNGYVRFKKSWRHPDQKGQFFHIWWFEHNHKRKVRLAHQIHHIDFDKKNNDLSNLEELSIYEHKQKHKTRFYKKH